MLAFLSGVAVGVLALFVLAAAAVLIFGNDDDWDDYEDTF